MKESKETLSEKVYSGISSPYKRDLQRPDFCLEVIDVKEKIQNVQGRLLKVIKKKGVVERSDIKWIFLEELGEKFVLSEMR